MRLIMAYQRCRQVLFHIQCPVDDLQASQQAPLQKGSHPLHRRNGSSGTHQQGMESVRPSGQLHNHNVRNAPSCHTLRQISELVAVSSFTFLVGVCTGIRDQRIVLDIHALIFKHVIRSILVLCR